MEKPELLGLIKQRHTVQFYKHIAECTENFKFEQLDSIISALDTKEQMEDFCQVATDEFNYLMNTPSMIESIQIKDGQGKPVGFIYDGEISKVLSDLMRQALKRLEIDAKYAKPTAHFVHPVMDEVVQRITDELERFWSDREKNPVSEKVYDRSCLDMDQQIVIANMIKDNLRENIMMFVDEKDLVNFTLKLNLLLSGTGWDAVSSSVLKEMLEYYKTKQTSDKPQVTVQPGAILQMSGQGSINNQLPAAL